MDTDKNGNGIVVKRLSVPVGLEELMEDLTREVLLKKPKDIYAFASEYFAHLLAIREQNKVKELNETAKNLIKNQTGRIKTKIVNDGDDHQHQSMKQPSALKIRKATMCTMNKSMMKDQMNNLRVNNNMNGSSSGNALTGLNRLNNKTDLIKNKDMRHKTIFQRHKEKKAKIDDDKKPKTKKWNSSARATSGADKVVKVAPRSHSLGQFNNDTTSKGSSNTEKTLYRSILTSKVLNKAEKFVQKPQEINNNNNSNIITAHNLSNDAKSITSNLVTSEKLNEKLHTFNKNMEKIKTKASNEQNATDVEVISNTTSESMIMPNTVNQIVAGEELQSLQPANIDVVNDQVDLVKSAKSPNSSRLDEIESKEKLITNEPNDSLKTSNEIVVDSIKLSTPTEQALRDPIKREVESLANSAEEVIQGDAVKIAEKADMLNGSRIASKDIETLPLNNSASNGSFNENIESISKEKGINEDIKSENKLVERIATVSERNTAGETKIDSSKPDERPLNQGETVASKDENDQMKSVSESVVDAANQQSINENETASNEMLSNVDKEQSKLETDPDHFSKEGQHSVAAGINNLPVSLTPRNAAMNELEKLKNKPDAESNIIIEDGKVLKDLESNETTEIESSLDLEKLSNVEGTVVAESRTVDEIKNASENSEKNKKPIEESQLKAEAKQSVNQITDYKALEQDKSNLQSVKVETNDLNKTAMVPESLINELDYAKAMQDQEPKVIAADSNKLTNESESMTKKKDQVLNVKAAEEDFKLSHDDLKKLSAEMEIVDKNAESANTVEQDSNKITREAQVSDNIEPIKETSANQLSESVRRDKKDTSKDVPIIIEEKAAESELNCEQNTSLTSDNQAIDIDGLNKDTKLKAEELTESKNEKVKKSDSDESTKLLVVDNVKEAIKIKEESKHEADHIANNKEEETATDYENEEPRNSETDELEKTINDTEKMHELKTGEKIPDDGVSLHQKQIVKDEMLPKAEKEESLEAAAEKSLYKIKNETEESESLKLEETKKTELRITAPVKDLKEATKVKDDGPITVSEVLHKEADILAVTKESETPLIQLKSSAKSKELDETQSETQEKSAKLLSESSKTSDTVNQEDVSEAGWKEENDSSIKNANNNIDNVDNKEVNTIDYRTKTRNVFKKLYGSIDDEINSDETSIVAEKDLDKDAKILPTEGNQAFNDAKLIKAGKNTSKEEVKLTIPAEEFINTSKPLDLASVSKSPEVASRKKRYVTNVELEIDGQISNDLAKSNDLQENDDGDSKINKSIKFGDTEEIVDGINKSKECDKHGNVRGILKNKSEQSIIIPNITDDAETINENEESVEDGEETIKPIDASHESGPLIHKLNRLENETTEFIQNLNRRKSSDAMNDAKTEERKSKLRLPTRGDITPPHLLSSRNLSGEDLIPTSEEMELIEPVNVEKSSDDGQKCEEVRKVTSAFLDNVRYDKEDKDKSKIEENFVTKPKESSSSQASARNVDEANMDEKLDDSSISGGKPGNLDPEEIKNRSDDNVKNVTEKQGSSNDDIKVNEVSNEFANENLKNASQGDFLARSTNTEVKDETKKTFDKDIIQKETAEPSKDHTPADHKEAETANKEINVKHRTMTFLESIRYNKEDTEEMEKSSESAIKAEASTMENENVAFLSKLPSSAVNKEIDGKSFKANGAEEQVDVKNVMSTALNFSETPKATAEQKELSETLDTLISNQKEVIHDNKVLSPDLNVGSVQNARNGDVQKKLSDDGSSNEQKSPEDILNSSEIDGTFEKTEEQRVNSIDSAPIKIDSVSSKSDSIATKIDSGGAEEEVNLRNLTSTFLENIRYNKEEETKIEREKLSDLQAQKETLSKMSTTSEEINDSDEHKPKNKLSQVTTEESKETDSSAFCIESSSKSEKKVETESEDPLLAKDLSKTTGNDLILASESSVLDKPETSLKDTDSNVKSETKKESEELLDSRKIPTKIAINSGISGNIIKKDEMIVSDELNDDLEKLKTQSDTFLETIKYEKDSLNTEEFSRKVIDEDLEETLEKMKLDLRHLSRIISQEDQHVLHQNSIESEDNSIGHGPESLIENIKDNLNELTDLINDDKEVAQETQDGYDKVNELIDKIEESQEELFTNLIDGKRAENSVNSQMKNEDSIRKSFGNAAIRFDSPSQLPTYKVEILNLDGEKPEYIKALGAMKDGSIVHSDTQRSNSVISDLESIKEVEEEDDDDVFRAEESNENNKKTGERKHEEIARVNEQKCKEVKKEETNMKNLDKDLSDIRIQKSLITEDTKTNLIASEETKTPQAVASSEDNWASDKTYSIDQTDDKSLPLEKRDKESGETISDETFLIRDINEKENKPPKHSGDEKVVNKVKETSENEQQKVILNGNIEKEAVTSKDSESIKKELWKPEESFQSTVLAEGKNGKTTDFREGKSEHNEEQAQISAESVLLAVGHEEKSAEKTQKIHKDTTVVNNVQGKFLTEEIRGKDKNEEKHIAISENIPKNQDSDSKENIEEGLKFIHKDQIRSVDSDISAIGGQEKSLKQEILGDHKKVKIKYEEKVLMDDNKEKIAAKEETIIKNQDFGENYSKLSENFEHRMATNGRDTNFKEENSNLNEEQAKIYADNFRIDGDNKEKSTEGTELIRKGKIENDEGKELIDDSREKIAAKEESTIKRRDSGESDPKSLENLEHKITTTEVATSLKEANSKFNEEQVKISADNVHFAEDKKETCTKATEKNYKEHIASVGSELSVNNEQEKSLKQEINDNVNKGKVKDEEKELIACNNEKIAAKKESNINNQDSGNNGPKLLENLEQKTATNEMSTNLEKEISKLDEKQVNMSTDKDRIAEHKAKSAEITEKVDNDHIVSVRSDFSVNAHQEKSLQQEIKDDDNKGKVKDVEKEFIDDNKEKVAAKKERIIKNQNSEESDTKSLQNLEQKSATNEMPKNVEEESLKLNVKQVQMSADKDRIVDHKEKPAEVTEKVDKDHIISARSDFSVNAHQEKSLQQEIKDNDNKGNIKDEEIELIDDNKEKVAAMKESILKNQNSEEGDTKSMESLEQKSATNEMSKNLEEESLKLNVEQVQMSADKDRNVDHKEKPAEVTEKVDKDHIISVRSDFSVNAHQEKSLQQEIKDDDNKGKVKDEEKELIDDTKEKVAAKKESILKNQNSEEGDTKSLQNLEEKSATNEMPKNLEEESLKLNVERVQMSADKDRIVDHKEKPAEVTEKVDKDHIISARSDFSVNAHQEKSLQQEIKDDDNKGKVKDEEKELIDDTKEKVAAKKESILKNQNSEEGDTKSMESLEQKSATNEMPKNLEEESLKLNVEQVQMSADKDRNVDHKEKPAEVTEKVDKDHIISARTDFSVNAHQEKSLQQEIKDDDNKGKVKDEEKELIDDTKEKVAAKKESILKNQNSEEGDTKSLQNLEQKSATNEMPKNLEEESLKLNVEQVQMSADKDRNVDHKEKPAEVTEKVDKDHIISVRSDFSVNAHQEKSLQQEIKDDDNKGKVKDEEKELIDDTKEKVAAKKESILKNQNSEEGDTKSLQNLEQKSATNEMPTNLEEESLKLNVEQVQMSADKDRIVDHKEKPAEVTEKVDKDHIISARSDFSVNAHQEKSLQQEIKDDDNKGKVKDEEKELIDDNKEKVAAKKESILKNQNLEESDTKSLQNLEQKSATNEMPTNLEEESLKLNVEQVQMSADKDRIVDHKEKPAEVTEKVDKDHIISVRSDFSVNAHQEKSLEQEIKDNDNKGNIKDEEIELIHDNKEKVAVKEESANKNLYSIKSDESSKILETPEINKEYCLEDSKQPVKEVRLTLKKDFETSTNEQVQEQVSAKELDYKQSTKDPPTLVVDGKTKGVSASLNPKLNDNNNNLTKSNVEVEKLDSSLQDTVDGIEASPPNLGESTNHSFPDLLVVDSDLKRKKRSLSKDAIDEKIITADLTKSHVMKSKSLDGNRRKSEIFGQTVEQTAKNGEDLAALPNVVTENRAASKIQKYWRTHKSNKFNNKRIKESGKSSLNEKQLMQAATIIQSLFRGYLARKHIDIMNYARTHDHSKFEEKLPTLTEISEEDDKTIDSQASTTLKKEDDARLQRIEGKSEELNTKENSNNDDDGTSAASSIMHSSEMHDAIPVVVKDQNESLKSVDTLEETSSGLLHSGEFHDDAAAFNADLRRSLERKDTEDASSKSSLQHSSEMHDSIPIGEITDQSLGKLDSVEKSSDDNNKLQHSGELHDTIPIGKETMPRSKSQEMRTGLDEDVKTGVQKADDESSTASHLTHASELHDSIPLSLKEDGQNSQTDPVDQRSTASLMHSGEFHDFMPLPKGTATPKPGSAALSKQFTDEEEFDQLDKLSIPTDTPTPIDRDTGLQRSQTVDEPSCEKKLAPTLIKSFSHSTEMPSKNNAKLKEIEDEYEDVRKEMEAIRSDVERASGRTVDALSKEIAGNDDDNDGRLGCLTHSSEMHDSIGLIAGEMNTAKEMNAKAEEEKSVKLEDEDEKSASSLMHSGEMHDSLGLIVGKMNPTKEKTVQAVDVEETDDKAENDDEKSVSSLMHSGEFHDSAALHGMQKRLLANNDADDTSLDESSSILQSSDVPEITTTTTTTTNKPAAEELKVVDKHESLHERKSTTIGIEIQPASDDAPSSAESHKNFDIGINQTDVDRLKNPISIESNFSTDSTGTVINGLEDGNYLKLPAEKHTDPMDVAASKTNTNLTKNNLLTNKNLLNSESTDSENDAALKIQSNYRGYRVRKDLRRQGTEINLSSESSKSESKSAKEIIVKDAQKVMDSKQNPSLTVQKSTEPDVLLHSGEFHDSAIVSKDYLTVDNGDSDDDGSQRSDKSSKSSRRSSFSIKNCMKEVAKPFKEALSGLYDKKDEKSSIKDTQGQQQESTVTQTVGEDKPTEMIYIPLRDYSTDEEAAKDYDRMSVDSLETDGKKDEQKATIHIYANDKSNEPPLQVSVDGRNVATIKITATKVPAREQSMADDSGHKSMEDEAKKSAVKPIEGGLMGSGEFHDVVPLGLMSETKKIDATTSTPIATEEVIGDSGSRNVTNQLPVQLSPSPAGVKVLTSQSHERVTGDVAGDAVVAVDKLIQLNAHNNDDDNLGAQASNKGDSSNLCSTTTTAATTTGTTTTVAAACHSNEPRAIVSMDAEKRKNATLRDTIDSNNRKRDPIGQNMEAEAATKIQAGFRGYKVRKQLKLKKNGDSDYTTTMENNNNRRAVRRKSSAILSAENGEIGAQKQSRASDLEERSATKIQAGIRGFLVRRRQQKNNNQNVTATN